MTDTDHDKTEDDLSLADRRAVARPLFSGNEPLWAAIQALAEMDADIEEHALSRRDRDEAGPRLIKQGPRMVRVLHRLSGRLKDAPIASDTLEAMLERQEHADLLKIVRANLVRLLAKTQDAWIANQSEAVRSARALLRILRAVNKTLPEPGAGPARPAKGRQEAAGQEQAEDRAGGGDGGQRDAGHAARGEAPGRRCQQGRAAGPGRGARQEGQEEQERRVAMRGGDR